MQAKLMVRNGTFAVIDVDSDSPLGLREGGYLRLSCDLLAQLGDRRNMDLDFLWYSLRKDISMRAVTNRSDFDLLEETYQELLKETQ